MKSKNAQLAMSYLNTLFVWSFPHQKVLSNFEGNNFKGGASMFDNQLHEELWRSKVVQNMEAREILHIYRYLFDVIFQLEGKVKDMTIAGLVKMNSLQRANMQEYLVEQLSAINRAGLRGELVQLKDNVQSQIAAYESGGGVKLKPAQPAIPSAAEFAQKVQEAKKEAEAKSAMAITAPISAEAYQQLIQEKVAVDNAVEAYLVQALQNAFENMIAHPFEQKTAKELALSLLQQQTVKFCQVSESYVERVIAEKLTTLGFVFNQA